MVDTLWGWLGVLGGSAVLIVLIFWLIPDKGRWSSIMIYVLGFVLVLIWITVIDGSFSKAA